MNDIPNWKDVNPRLGVSYDLFGNGRTALKTSIGRYVAKTNVDVSQLLNPINTSVNAASRAWNDDNHNFVPDCDLGNFAANGELFADRFEECFRWRLAGGTNGAGPTLERLALFKPAGIDALLPTPAGVVFNTAHGSKLVGYDQLATEPSDWKQTPAGPIGVSPDGGARIFAT